MTDLTKKKCLPCEGGVVPLVHAEIWDLHRNTPMWSISSEILTRSFKFKNFAQALKFVNKVGKIAEKEGHHPDIELGWGYANLVLTTHAIGGLSENDFIVAAKIDKILGE